MKDFRKKSTEDEVDVVSAELVPSDTPDERDLVTKTSRTLPTKHEREDRMAKVWEMRLRGVSTSNIAAALNIEKKSVYSDLKALGRRFREDILHTDPLTMVAENLQWLEELERVALFEVARSDKSKSVQEVVTQEGKVEKVVIDLPDTGSKSRFYQAALKAREMRLDLLFKTGVIPKNPEELFKGLERFQEKSEDIEATAERSEEDIKESIDNLLKYGNKM